MVGPDSFTIEDKLEYTRHIARCLYDFIREGVFLDGIEYAETDTPEWHLWVKRHVVEALVDDNPWLKDEG